MRGVQRSGRRVALSTRFRVSKPQAHKSMESQTCTGLRNPARFYFYLSIFKTILLLVRSHSEGYGYGVPPGCNLPAQPPEPSASRSEVLPHPKRLQHDLPDPFCGIASQQLPAHIHLLPSLPLPYKPPSARFYEKRHAGSSGPFGICFRQRLPFPTAKQSALPFPAHLLPHSWGIPTCLPATLWTDAGEEGNKM